MPSPALVGPSVRRPPGLSGNDFCARMNSPRFVLTRVRNAFPDRVQSPNAYSQCNSGYPGTEYAKAASEMDGMHRKDEERSPQI